jgi:hypothetical protein
MFAKCLPFLLCPIAFCAEVGILQPLVVSGDKLYKQAEQVSGSVTVLGPDYVTKALQANRPTHAEKPWMKYAGMPLMTRRWWRNSGATSKSLMKTSSKSMRRSGNDR